MTNEEKPDSATIAQPSDRSLDSSQESATSPLARKRVGGDLGAYAGQDAPKAVETASEALSPMSSELPKAVTSTLSADPSHDEYRPYYALMIIVLLLGILAYGYFGYTTLVPVQSNPLQVATTLQNTVSKPQTELSECNDMDCVETKLAANPGISAHACQGMDKDKVNTCYFIHLWEVQKKPPKKEWCDRFLDPDLKRVCNRINSEKND
jgi:hypothetical protein